MASNNEERSPSDDTHLEKADDDLEAPPKPVGFFHPALNNVRKQVFLLWARTSKCGFTFMHSVADLDSLALILMVFILAVLALCRPQLRYRALPPS